MSYLARCVNFHIIQQPIFAVSNYFEEFCLQIFIVENNLFVFEYKYVLN